MTADKPIQARRYIVRGRVQGVGFRWFVEREAHLLGITGWVRNNHDGRSWRKALVINSRGCIHACAKDRGPRESMPSKFPKPIPRTDSAPFA